MLRLAGERRVTVIRSPRSKVSFFSLGDFEGQVSNHALPADTVAPVGYPCKQAPGQCNGVTTDACKHDPM